MRDPLTREQLQEIQDRNLDSPDVLTLLWELKRLRGLTLRTHDYFRHDAGSSTASTLADRLRDDLSEEPVVNEQPTL